MCGIVNLNGGLFLIGSLKFYKKEVFYSGPCNDIRRRLKSLHFA